MEDTTPATVKVFVQFQQHCRPVEFTRVPGTPDVILLKDAVQQVSYDVYAEITDEPQDWIHCDSCLKWFYFECANIDPKSVPEQFVCDFVNFIYAVLAMMFCIYVLMKILCAFHCPQYIIIEIFFQLLYIPGQMPFLSPTLLGRGKEGHLTN